MKLIVGLGNPGDKYEGVRHNLGFMVLDEFVKSAELRVENVEWKFEKKFNSQLYILNSKFILVKPQTYMNNSGMSVRALVDFYKISTEDVVVIHDDLDLILGKIKVRTGGAAAGHHGVESIISAISDNFTRVRIGIGNEKSHLGEHQRVSFEAEKFVLNPFTPQERSKLKHIIKQTIEILETEVLE